MAFVSNAWYIDFGDGSTTGYYAIPMWTTLTAYPAGYIVRQRTTPAVGSERVFVCIVAGTALASEPNWALTRGAKTAEAAGPTWQECSGQPSLNGDATNTPSWTISATPPGGVKNTVVTLGQIIKRDNGVSYQICSAAGTAGNGAEPGFSDTAGVTTADNTVTWTSLGVVGNFTGWQAPHARLNNAFAGSWGVAGNTFFVASGHAETRSTSMTLTSPATAAAPCSILSVTKTTVPPASANITPGATILTTGTASLTLTDSGGFYDGLYFSAGSAANNTGVVFSAFQGKIKNGGLILNTTGSTSTISIGTNTTTPIKYVLDNVTMQFGHVGQCIAHTHGLLTWEKTPSAIVGATIPTNLFSGNCSSASLEINGVDLSALGAGKTIFGATSGMSKRLIKNSKIDASVTITPTPSAPGAAEVTLIRVDSGATNYRTEKYQYQGTQTVETTIVLTGGASDGTTPISWKIVTTANSNWLSPFEAIPIAIWNDTVGSAVTATIQGVWGGGAVPNNDEIWLEAEYLGSTLTPQGSFATGGKADSLVASSALAAGAGTWGGSTTKFKLTVTFTPQMKGAVYLYVCAAKLSSTFYVDPKVTLT